MGKNRIEYLKFSPITFKMMTDFSCVGIKGNVLTFQKVLLMPITLYTSQLFLREIRERERSLTKNKNRWNSWVIKPLLWVFVHLTWPSIICCSLLNELRGLGSSSFCRQKRFHYSIFTHFFFVVVIVTKTLTRCVWKRKSDLSSVLLSPSSTI